MNVFSISGSEYGDPCNAYGYDEEVTGSNNHEGVVYLQETGSVDAYVMKDNTLCNFCEGVWFGAKGTAPEIDTPGAAGSEFAALALVCKDDAPTLQHFCISSVKNNLAAWFFPMFCPLGIAEPDAPSKSAKIAG